MTPRRPVVAGTLALFCLLMGTGAALPVGTHAPQAGPPSRTEAVPVVIPLHDDEGWQLLRYRDIPPHAVDFTPLGLRIQVENSAAPFVYPLSAPMAVSRLTVRGRVDGALRLAWQRQGSEGFDDYVFKAGLVLTGSRRLGRFRRMFAPAWVRTLYGLALPDQGISIVRFFNVGIDPDQVGQRRVHPLTRIIQEGSSVAVADDGGNESAEAPTLDVQRSRPRDAGGVASTTPPVETVAVHHMAKGTTRVVSFDDPPAGRNRKARVRAA